MKLTAERTARIRELNDLARTAMGVTSRVVQTRGISALPPALQSRIRERVETFAEFNTDNDPYHEHDLGTFELDGHDVMWKIDYYDLAYEGHSDDAADPKKTRRVLTIMLGSEY